MIIHEIEQNSPEWFELRAGIPTASAFSKLVTSTGAPSKQIEAYALLLAAEKFTGGEVESWEGNYHTQRGHELEPQAREAYSFISDDDVQDVGFITDDQKLYGCSPDGLVGDHGILEIKCLKAENHIKTLMKKDRGCPADYLQQVQGQLFVTGRAHCDLFFFHPTLPKFSIRVAADTGFHMKLAAAIQDVIERRDAALKVLEQYG
jgi:putative phage-type endonuclease